MILRTLKRHVQTSSEGDIVEEWAWSYGHDDCDHHYESSEVFMELSVRHCEECIQELSTQSLAPPY